MEEKQQTETGVTIQSFQNSLNLVNTFSYSERSVFIYKKTEKLVVATSLIAGFIKDNPSLSDTLKRKTLELLSSVSKSILAKAAVSSEDRYQASLQALALIVEISSLCDVGHYSKHISEMNATLLKREFASLHKIISGEVAGMGAPTEHLTRDFFTEVESDFYKGHNKGHNMSFTKSPHQASHRDVHVSGHSIVGGATSDVSIAKVHGNSLSSDARSNRRTLILKTIKERGEVGVADVIHAVKGVGEKTIQRELLAMVSEGILKKQGERRWSRYSII